MREKYSPDPTEMELKEKESDRAKREIFDMAGNRTPEEVEEMIVDVGIILREEKERGEDFLEDTISEIERGSNGEKYFVDGNVAYLPRKGEAYFVGDIHGDADSLISIIEQSEFIQDMEEGEKEKTLVLLGDYGDRGEDGAKALELLMDLKKRYPDNVILMRGNHEELGQGMDFRINKNCLHRVIRQKYFPDTVHKDGIKGTNLFLDYMKLFEQLPGVLVTASGIVAVHGGIPKNEISSLKQLNDENVLEQMRWADPDKNINGIELNIDRSDSDGEEESAPILFGKKAFLEGFMNTIGGNVMLRSHEAKKEGFEVIFNEKLATIFSTGGSEAKSSAYRTKVRTPRFAKVRLDQDKIEWEDGDFKEVLYS